MKFKTTNKAIKDGYLKVFRIGYCDAQYLLSFISPVAYTSGVYGWNADVYEFGVVRQIAIVTGYRPGVGERVDYDLLKKYEKKAEKIRYNNKLSYTQQKNRITKLLNEFISEIDK